MSISNPSDPAPGVTTGSASAQKVRVLAVDDEPISNRLIHTLFEREGYEVRSAETGAQALQLAREHDPQIAVVDLHLPDMDGLQLMERLRALKPSLPVIVLTSDGDIATAVRAMQLGARSYLTKPPNRDELLLTMQRALEHESLVSEVQDLRRRARPGLTLAEQMGPGPEVARLAEQIALVASSNLTVLIQGETGTGKELVAQAIHRESGRGERPLIAVDCGAIPEALLESELFGHEKGAFTGADRRRVGHFQLAEGGTLFLDEIGNLPQILHPKLLRVLESRELTPLGATRKAVLDVRFVAATNVDLPVRVRDGAFREDLFFRLAQYTITLPPLRERPGDLPHLVRRFQDEACLEMRRPVVEITPDAMQALQKHPWPGNARELRNVIRLAVLHSRNMVIHGDLIRSVMHCQPDRPAASVAQPLMSGRSLREVSEAAAQEAEAAMIRAALRSASGNKSTAAKSLRTDYKTLHLKIRRYGIRMEEFKKR